MDKVTFYKAFEYSPYVVRDDNSPEEIFCGLSLEEARKCAFDRFLEISGDGLYVEVYVLKMEMDAKEIKSLGPVFTFNNRMQ